MRRYAPGVRIWLAAGLAAVLMGCASVDQTVRATAISPALQDVLLAADAALGHPPQAVAEAALRLSTEMRRHLDQVIRPAAKRGDNSSRRALLDALFDHRGLKLEYASDHTRTAAEAYAERQGNCLSLVLMTTAFADELGVRVRLRQVLTQPTWTRSGNLVLEAGHVNLSLAPGLDPRILAGSDLRSEWVVDFLPGQDLARQRVRDIDRTQLLAMYLNNRAVEALMRQDVREAWRQVRAAVGLVPGDAQVRNTLAVVLHRAGLTREAQAQLREALTLQPDHVASLSNLQGLVAAAGQPAEAQELARRLAQLQPQPPYAYYEQARAALAQRQWAEARTLAERELIRAPEDPSIYLVLAQALQGLGDEPAALAQLQLARLYSQDEAQRQRFHAKINALRAF